MTRVKSSRFKTGGDKKDDRRNRNRYLGNSFVAGLQRTRSYTEHAPSRLNADCSKAINGRLAMYFLMQKGEFPTSLMGFEFALHTHHQKKNPPRGVKQCLPRAGVGAACRASSSLRRTTVAEQRPSRWLGQPEGSQRLGQLCFV